MGYQYFITVLLTLFKIGYSDIHQITLKTLMSYGTLEKDKFNEIFEILFTKLYPDEPPPTSHDNEEIIDTINAKIQRYDQQIVKFQFGLNQAEYYIFYSTAKTSISSMHHTFTENELDYFKMLLLIVIENEDLNISPLNALNIQTATKINKTRIEKMLDNWIMNGYFVREDNKIYLGPKSVIEFKEIIQSMELNHLRSCLLCEDIAAWVSQKC